jgi:FkbH-like protein
VEAHPALFDELSALRKRGRVEDALRALRSALRASDFAPEEIERAGRFLAKQRRARDRDLHVRICAQCTAAWFRNVLEAWSYRDGLDLSIEVGQFDNVVQDLAALSASERADEILVLLPWTERLLGGDALDANARVERVAEELRYWQQVWSLARSRGISRILQIGYDWTGPGALGQHLGSRQRDGDVALVRQLNDALRSELPRGAYFVDLEQVSGELGRKYFYDLRQYRWTKQPFSSLGLVELARAVSAGLRALSSGSKKVLVLDLDNTLWGGVVGEIGPRNVRLGGDAEGEAYQAFQRHLKALSQRGVLLAIASKNNPADAREPFELHGEMALSLADFAAFEASWEPKSEMLRKLAARLRLGLDSFVFFDDNPAEREHIRQTLPEVEVIDVPLEPAEYTRALERSLWFESVSLTVEDRTRTEQYAAERARSESLASASMEDYLTSLQMRATVRAIDEADLPRVVQLLGKTNQFNLTTRRHGEEQVRRMLAEPGALGLTVRMADRYGDSGLVACVLALPEPDVRALRIDTWLMSCRVIGRTLEHLTLRELASHATRLGYRRLIGEYIPTAKNQLVARLYEDLGFSADSRGVAVGEPSRFAVELPLSKPPVTFVTLVN